MTNEAVYLTSPVGHFIMGDAFTGSDKDHQGRPRLDQNQQPKMQWFMALAIPKNDPGWEDLWNQITAVGQRDFPNGDWQRPDFAWKVADGDSKYPDRPECRGCYVVRLSSGFAPTVWNPQNQQIVDAAQCKRGDYVRCYISMRGNDDRNKPGVYLNHQMVQVCGYGEAINSGPSAEQAFGAAPATLPSGASATPVAPSGAMPAQPGAAPVYAAPPQAAPAPAPVYAAPPTAPAPVPVPTQPAPGFAPAPGVPAQQETGFAAPTPPIAQSVATTSPSNPGAPAPYPQIMNGPTE